MTAHGSLDIPIEVIKKGAFYYIEKPFTPDQVVTLAERALESISEPIRIPHSSHMIASLPEGLV